MIPLPLPDPRGEQGDQVSDKVARQANAAAITRRTWRTLLIETVLILTAAISFISGSAMIDVYGSKKHYTPALLGLGVLCWLGGVAMGVLAVGFVMYRVIRALRQPQK